MGTGDRAYGLALLFKNHNVAHEQNSLVVTSPTVRKGRLFHDTGIPIVSYDDAFATADIIIYSMESSSLKQFAADYVYQIKGKVLVDATSSFCHREDLHSILAITGMRFVKAFHDVTERDILGDRPFHRTKISSKVYSPSSAASQLVKIFGEMSLGLDMKIVPFRYYRTIALTEKSVGGDLMQSAWLMLSIFLVTEVYSIVRYVNSQVRLFSANTLFLNNQFKHSRSYFQEGIDCLALPLHVTNKSIAWTAISGFTLMQLPNVLFNIWRDVYPMDLFVVPTWLRFFLRMKTSLGMISLWLLMIHAMVSLATLSPVYYATLFLATNNLETKMNFVGEMSILWGVFGVAFFWIFGFGSIPSVGVNMSRLQVYLITDVVVWIGLICGTIHVMVIGINSWNDVDSWPGSMPPVSLVSVFFPLLTIGLKVIQVLHTILTHCCSSSKITDHYGTHEITIKFDDDEVSCSTDNRNDEGSNESCEIFVDDNDEFESRIDSDRYT